MQAAPDCPPKFKLQVKSVIQQTQYSLRLINNQGDVLQMITDQMTLSEKDLDLYQLLEEINLLFANQAKEKESQFKIEVGPFVPQYIHLDRDKLRQVLIECVDNALNFTLKGEIVLSVEASLIAQNQLSKQYQLSFRVTDTGMGLVKEKYHQLVERFKMNSDIAMSDALQEKSGLGLSISHYLIHQMKGDMTIVHSEMDQGSTFQFEVPANEAIAFKLTQSHYQMLIAADKNQNSQPLFDLLISLGFDWHCLQKAGNEHEMKNLLAYWPLELIWMDIEMGNQDGIEITRLIKASPAYQGIIVVLMMSATQWEQRRDEALSAGCNDCLIKPFEANKVLQIIEEQLGVREFHQEEPDESYEEEDTTLFMSTLENAGTPESIPTSVLDLDSSMIEALMTLPDELLNELLTQAFHTTGYKDFLLELFAQFREQDKYFAKTFDSKVDEEAYYAKLTLFIFQQLRRRLH